MSVTLAELHALARQAGVRPRVAPSASFARSVPRRPPLDVHALRALLRLREPQVPRVAASAADRALPGVEISPGLRLIEARLPVPPLPPMLVGDFDRREAFDPRRVLFFDTETTGLAGGTGTRAFLLGAAAWEGSALHVRQLLITTLAAEASMLKEFAGWLRPDTLLSSYNGKSYDSPLLRTRYGLARLPDPISGLPHVDLLYPVRRRYRGQYENCRLVTIERHVLKIVRDDDLPGSEAPAAWLTWLRGDSARNLRRVLDHNRQDVASLARLMRHLGG